jgi:beta-lactamase class A
MTAAQAACRHDRKHSMKPTLVCTILFWSFLMGQAAAAGTDQGAFMQEIHRLEALYGGRLGFMAKNLNTGEVVGLNAAEQFPTASVIKLPVMATFFHLADQKTVDPAMKVVFRNDEKKEGSGVLQFLGGGTTITLLDAVKLMIILSDNTATNLVLDRIAPTHAERMKVVNDFLVSKGLKNTRILNRLYSWNTKQTTPEGIRYGIGVATPEDMVTLLEGLFRKTLADSASCQAMVDIMKNLAENDRIPRFLPASTCTYLDVVHKTGTIGETKVDVGLVLSDRVSIAMAIFVDKCPDHEETLDNPGILLAAHVARAVWNHFTGDAGYERHGDPGNVDWTWFPGGKWGIFRSTAAPFPHPARNEGLHKDDGTFYPRFPHYADSSVVVYVPDCFAEGPDGANVIVHFHGHMNDNLGVLERYQMPQAMNAQKINALLVIPQGPNRARDSFGGKIEDAGGLARLVSGVLETMKREKVVSSDRVGNVIVSAHSGGDRPAAFALHHGGLTDRITDVFLFDAFYELHDYYSEWLRGGKGVVHAAYTEHLAPEHEAFADSVGKDVGGRFMSTRTEVDHDQVVQTFLSQWLAGLGDAWKGHTQ